MLKTTQTLADSVRCCTIAAVLALAGTACGPSGNGEVPYLPGPVSTCTNGALDSDESDIDCGGACAVCADGLACGTDTDCGSGYCGTNGVCSSPACNNGQLDAGETGVDCGGACGGCIGDSCGNNDVCKSAYCNSGVCDVATCSDGLSNGAETGIDCGGGDCPLCGVGQGCVGDANCVSSYCGKGYCAEPACDDGTLNGNETDIDCGGACGGCDIGEKCAKVSDCLDGVCPDGVCAPLQASCSDGTKNGEESDLDCGGSECKPCASSKFCDQPSDCLSNTCSFGVCKDPTCDDGVLNQDETDLDCGGSSCGPCEDGQMCSLGEDCDSGRCPSGTCATCDDGVKDLDELGIDCGGACAPCGDGTPCDSDAICGSGLCVGNVCVACNNGIKDGDESDIDCGGSCGACGPGKTCGAVTDCGDNLCEAGKCCSANACGFCGATPAEVCNGVDDDCDGQVDEVGGIGTPPACDLQAGVCAGAQAVCQGAAGWVCDASVYGAHNADYQATEAACDALDNDCDGQVDVGLFNSCGQCGADPLEACNGVDDDCDGEVDEGGACAVCDSVVELVCTSIAVMGQNALAWADGHMHLAYDGVESNIVTLNEDLTVAGTMTADTSWGFYGPHLFAEGDTLNLLSEGGDHFYRPPGGSSFVFQGTQASGFRDVEGSGDTWVALVETNFSTVTAIEAAGSGQWTPLGSVPLAASYKPVRTAVSDNGEVVLAGELPSGDLGVTDPEGTFQTSVGAGTNKVSDLAFDGQGRLHVLIQGYSESGQHRMRNSDGSWTVPFSLYGSQNRTFIKQADGRLQVVGSSYASEPTLVWTANSDYSQWTAEAYGPYGDQMDGRVLATFVDPYERVLIAQERHDSNGSDECIHVQVLCPNKP